MRRQFVRSAPLLLSTLLAIATVPVGGQQPRREPYVAASDSVTDDVPAVRVWIDGDPSLRSGAPARVLFRADRDAFVVVARIGSDGRLSVLFPASPLDDGEVVGDRPYVAGGGVAPSFRASEPPGIGLVFAIAADEPFDFRPLMQENRWRHLVAGLGWYAGASAQAIDDFATSIIFDDRVPYNYDAQYYSVSGPYLYGAPAVGGAAPGRP